METHGICAKCGKTLSSRNGLKQHVKICVKKPNFICPRCKKHFPYKCHYDKHMDRVRPCNVNSLPKKDLKDQLDEPVTTNTNIVKISPQLSPFNVQMNSLISPVYVVPDINAAYEMKQGFQDNCLNTTENHSNTEMLYETEMNQEGVKIDYQFGPECIAQNTFDSNKNYCKVCNKCFSGKTSTQRLKQHMKTCAFKPTTYNCPRCKIPFEFKSKYDVHVRKCKGKKIISLTVNGSGPCLSPPALGKISDKIKIITLGPMSVRQFLFVHTKALCLLSSPTIISQID